MLNWHFKIRTVYNKQNHSILIRPIYLGQAKKKNGNTLSSEDRHNV